MTGAWHDVRHLSNETQDESPRGVKRGQKNVRRGPAETPAPERSPREGVQSLMVAEGTATAIRRIPVVVCICFCVYYAADALKLFAGKVSSADMRFVLSVLGDFKFSWGLTIAATGAGWAYGLRQRKLRRDTIARIQTRVIELEKEINQSRMSSGLPPRGTTREDDKR